MDDVEVAIAAVSAGAAVVHEQFGTALGRFDKGDGDFATTADVASERAMLDVIRRERPDHGVLGEELGRGGADASPFTWLIDPLCGTLNYAAGMPLVAVNAALTTANGTVVAAAVADPFAGAVLWSDGYAACVRSDGRDAMLEPSAASRLVDLNFDPPFPNRARFRAVQLAADDRFAATFKPRVISSSLALAWVASGQRAAYVTDGNLRASVHFTAAIEICRAAGCTISSLSGDSWDGEDGGLIAAADDQTHGTLLTLIGSQ